VTSGANKLFILICLLRTCLFRRYPILQYALETRDPAFYKMGFHLKGFSWNERHLSTIRLPDDFLLGLSSTTFPTSFGFTLSGLFSIQPTLAKQQRNVEPSQFHFLHFSV
tara:strand:- start:40 stop:369 length:330 start_codon:yes stop_codon:yes gene_type:complete